MPVFLGVRALELREWHRGFVCEMLYVETVG